MDFFYEKDLFKIEDEALKLISNDVFLKIEELREKG